MFDFCILCEEMFPQLVGVVVVLFHHPGNIKNNREGGGGVDIGRIKTPMEKGSGNLINLTHTNPPKTLNPPHPV